MSKIELDILARIESLHPFVGEDWSSGPYSTEEIRHTEKQLGRTLDAHHKMMLERLGGKFTFEMGAVNMRGMDQDVNMFFGLGKGDPCSIVNEWKGYGDQFPETWYPFAMDSRGHFYCLTEDGAVHHVELEEDERTKRPETAGYCVADSFADFVMSLHLPDWARDYFEQQENGEGGNHCAQD